MLVPGASIVVASNPLLSHIVAGALAEMGLERRGEIIRLVITMRGRQVDRPKGAHDEFSEVSVMPRSMWEPWLVFRNRVHELVRTVREFLGHGAFSQDDTYELQTIIDNGIC